MGPDRSNYEIWIIDWLDGKLSRQMVDQLMEFLKKNPDLKEEAESLSSSYLSHHKNAMQRKNDLMRSASELESSQIEYLSAGYLENDLTDEQQSDLMQAIHLNPRNKTLFESVQKVKLKPPQITYSNKKLLIKITLWEKVLKYSALGLSAAATIALIVLSITSAPEFSPAGPKEITGTIIPDNSHIQPFVITAEVLYDLSEQSRVNIRIPSADKKLQQTPSIAETANYNDALPEDDTITTIIRSALPVIPVSFLPFEPRIESGVPHNELVASNNNFSVPDFLRTTEAD